MKKVPLFVSLLALTFAVVGAGCSSRHRHVSVSGIIPQYILGDVPRIEIINNTSMYIEAPVGQHKSGVQIIPPGQSGYFDVSVISDRTVYITVKGWKFWDGKAVKGYAGVDTRTYNLHPGYHQYQPFEVSYFREPGR